MRILTHLALLAALPLLLLAPACKTVSRVTKVESISANESSSFAKGVFKKTNAWSDVTQYIRSDEEVANMSKRKRKKYERELAEMRSGVSSSMDKRRVETTDLFGGTRSNQQFGGESVGKKKYAGNTRFRGDKEYTREGYQFLKDREMAREAAAAAGQKFGERDKLAGESRKSWFGRDKTVARDRSGDADKSFDTRALPGTTGSDRVHNETVIGIQNPAGRDGDGGTLSMDQLRDMMGRGELGSSRVAPLEQ